MIEQMLKPDAALLDPEQYQVHKYKLLSSETTSLPTLMKD